MQITTKELYNSDIDHPDLGEEGGTILTLAFQKGDEVIDIELNPNQVRKLRQELESAEFCLFGRID